MLTCINPMVHRGMDVNDRYKLMGYLSMLEQATRGNGAAIHDIKQHITLIKLCLGMSRRLPEYAESNIKNLIHLLYDGLDRN